MKPWKRETTELASNDSNKLASDDSKLATIREDSSGRISFGAFTNLSSPGSNSDLANESIEVGKGATMNQNSDRPMEATTMTNDPARTSRRWSCHWKKHCNSNAEAVGKWSLLLGLGLAVVFLGISFVWTPMLVFLIIVTVLVIGFFAVRWTLLKEEPLFRSAMEPVPGITARATEEESNEDEKTSIPQSDTTVST